LDAVLQGAIFLSLAASWSALMMLAGSERAKDRLVKESEMGPGSAGRRWFRRRHYPKGTPAYRLFHRVTDEAAAKAAAAIRIPPFPSIPTAAEVAAAIRIPPFPSIPTAAEVAAAIRIPPFPSIPTAAEVAAAVKVPALDELREQLAPLLETALVEMVGPDGKPQNQAVNAVMLQLQLMLGEFDAIKATMFVELADKNGERTLAPVLPNLKRIIGEAIHDYELSAEASLMAGAANKAKREKFDARAADAANKLAYLREHPETIEQLDQGAVLAEDVELFEKYGAKYLGLPDELVKNRRFQARVAQFLEGGAGGGGGGARGGGSSGVGVHGGAQF